MSRANLIENSIAPNLNNIYYKNNSDLDEKNLDYNSLSSGIFSTTENKDNNYEISSLTGSRTLHISRGKWSKEEDEKLTQAVNLLGAKNWKNVAQYVEGRTPIQCLHRWAKILQPGLVKGPWTVEEDRKLLDWVNKEGVVRWSACAQYIKGRSGKQCRERYFNTLIPNVKKGNWTSEEDFILFKLFNQFGSQWSKIAKFFKGRTENSIKNRFYSTLRRIATEKKKQKRRIAEIEEDCSISRFKELAQFIPNAMNEKMSKLLHKKRQPRLAFSNITERFSQKERKFEKPDIIKEKARQIHNQMQKDYHPHEQAINNITLNYNFNFNNFNNPLCPLPPPENNIYAQLINHPQESYFQNLNDEYNLYNNMPLHTLENKIEDFNMFNQNENNYHIENQISSFINNFFDTNQEQPDSSILRKPCVGCDVFDKNTVKEDNSALVALIKQIDDLEKILQETKSELLKSSLKNSK